jgi:riboflavin synthase
MFTGLIQDVGLLERVTPGSMSDFWVRTGLAAERFEAGESIAVDGACLTVLDSSPTHFHVQAAPETLRRTTLGQLGPGSRVNLERALRLGDRLGGHLVLGHVDGTAQILERTSEGGSVVLRCSLPERLEGLFIEKGSVAVDGISLTLARVDPGTFAVMLIPQTLQSTALGEKKLGQSVNLEADVIGKYISRLYSLRDRRPTGPVLEG